MLPRHWERIEQVAGHHFDVDSENFTLKNVVDAPLLKHKEDIEVHVLSCFVLFVLGFFFFVIINL